MSKRNQEYWSNKDYRAKVAYRHIEYMENNFQEEIIDSVNRSIQFTGNVNNISKRHRDILRYEAKIIIDNIDIVSDEKSMQRMLKPKSNHFMNQSDRRNTDVWN